MNKEKIKNVIIIILLCLFVLVTTLFVISKKDENKSNEVTVTIEAVGKKYLLGSSENKDYLITNYKGDYKEEDKIKFTYKNKDRKEKVGLINIKVSDEDLIINHKKKEENETKDDYQSTVDSSNISDENNQVNTLSIDNEVVTYINKMKNDSGTNNLKTNFVILVDFVFYDGTIKGHTFKELGNMAKLKVLEAMLYLDSKVEKYFPNYKEEISSKTGRAYTTIKDKVVSSYLSITSAICNKDSSVCDSAKEDFQNLKKNFGLTWSVIKEVAGDSKESIKNWYEIWSGKK